MYGDAWHGPSVMEALEGITAEQAIKHPLKNAHSVWEITLHITGWFRIMVQRFRGENPEVSRAIDWPEIPDKSEEAWAKAIDDLKRAHKEYQNAIQDTSESELFVEIPGRGFDLYTLYHGMIQHCLYHAGQIMILKKSFS